MRLAAAPISFVVSYVRLLDVTQTYINGITLQDADREVIPLDEMTDREFTELAEGVATVRIQRIAPSAEAFDTRAVFGHLDINELLTGILTQSSSPEAKRLLASAQSFASAPFLNEFSETEGYPPIYQTYISEKLGLQIPSPDSPRWERRKQASAEIRKRMVAAYLCICRELRTDVKYAGAEMVLQISDKCIRDYLSILDAAFSGFSDAVEDFGKRRVAPDIQNSAIKDASTRKNDSIPRSEVGSPLETQRLIEALGKLTNRLQTTIRDERSLRSPERGVFVISSHPGSSSEVVSLITEAAEAGFLKMARVDERTIKFRLHCSLSAFYAISYRGAYYDCPLREDDLLLLYRDKDPLVRRETLTKIGDMLLRSDRSLPLFEGTI